MTEVLNIDKLTENSSLTRVEVFKIFKNKIIELCKYNLCDEIITNAYLASTIQDFNEFTTSNSNNVIMLNSSPSIPYNIGSFINIKLYIDSYMRWDDKRIIFKKSLKAKRKYKFNKILNINTDKDYIKELIIIDNNDILL
jgi:hypothetical protein